MGNEKMTKKVSSLEAKIRRSALTIQTATPEKLRLILNKSNKAKGGHKAHRDAAK